MLFFTSDQHYGHKNIVKYCSRPYGDVDAMNADLIARHNSRVGPDDDVWHLGDFSMRTEVMKSVLPQLAGRHHLVMGNHDTCHPCHGTSAGWRRDDYIKAGFITVVERTWLELPAPLGRVLLCHMPLENAASEYDTRHMSWRPTQAELGDAWLIHGHVHGWWRTQDKMINVGVDVWNFAPARADEVAALCTANGPMT